MGKYGKKEKPKMEFWRMSLLGVFVLISLRLIYVFNLTLLDVILILTVTWPIEILIKKITER